jgi:hypothetical protein
MHRFQVEGPHSTTQQQQQQEEGTQSIVRTLNQTLFVLRKRLFVGWFSIKDKQTVEAVES